MAESSALHAKLDELSGQLSAMIDEGGGGNVAQIRSPLSGPMNYGVKPSVRPRIDRIEDSERPSGEPVSTERPNRGVASAEGSTTFDAAIGNLMTQVEKSEARTHATVKALQDRIAQIGERAATSANQAVRETAAPIEDLEHRLADIGARLDRRRVDSDKHDRIESLEKKIAEFARFLPELGAEPVEGLAAEALRPQTDRLPVAEDSGAIRALEARVQHIADRLGAQERLLDTVRPETFMARLPPAPGLAERPHGESEIRVARHGPTQGSSPERKDFRQRLHAAHDAARSIDRRTQETLVAVHETLDGVVERMNRIETEKDRSRSHLPAGRRKAAEGGKRRRSVLAGTMALTIGAVGAYSLLNGYAGLGSLLQQTSIVAAYGLFKGHTGIPRSAGIAERSGSADVRTAESVPGDPSASRESGGLGTIPASPDPGRTDSADDVSEKSAARRPALDPQVTSIEGFAATAGTTAATGGLGRARDGTAPDPSANGSTSGARTSETGDGSDLTAVQVAALASLPKALGTEAMLRAAVKGDKVAQFMVATRFSEGKVVDKDLDQAAVWYHKAASGGLAPAQYRLGTLYERGLGVKKDAKSARAWYEHAAHRGHVKAMHNLAVFHANGSGGKKKFNQAGYWFRKAANLGLKDSQYNLAILHEEGLGVRKDPVEAYRWYTLAARQNDDEADKRLQKVKSGLTSPELERAERLVETWRPGQTDSSANVVTPPDGGWRKVPTAGTVVAVREESDVLPGQAVKEVQQLLNDIGYDAGSPDGQMGPQTAGAIKRFQRQRGHRPTGKVTRTLLEQLRKLRG